MQVSAQCVAQMAKEMQMQDGSNVQGIVQTILNAINYLPNSPQACE